MTEHEALELAVRTVADELKAMTRVREDIYQQVADEEDGKFVHAWINNIVGNLRGQLATYADDRGISLERP